MFDAIAPYFTVLPFGMALAIAMLGPIPAIAVVVRAQKKPATTAQTFFAGSSGLIGAWACLNVVTPLILTV